MKCDNCEACRSEGYEYPEYYCAAGVPEDGKMATDGGCKYTAKVIHRRLERNDRARDHQYDGIGEWWAEREGKERAMTTAMQKALDEFRSGQLYLCFRNKDGRYYPLCGDGKATTEFSYIALDDFEDKEKAVQLEFCKKCRWKERTQKCTCCRRNRHMKDNYEAVEDNELAWLEM